ncbi:MAG: outer membrane protein assembly factor BamB [Candidatus Promineifilaceae bacterium]|jgi:outer membrane protein assembly factor BamB
MVRWQCFMVWVFSLTVVMNVNGQAWTRFRGPNGAGLADAAGVPSVWTEADYNWKTKLEGVGHSQPVFWGDKIFLTSALDDGAKRLVQCINAADGSVLWQKVFTYGSNRVHRFNSYASSTPAVDSEHVYVTFADSDSYDLYALTHHGDQVWRYQLGKLYSNHGMALSPICVGDLVVLGKEQGRKAPEDVGSYIVAVDSKRGEERWRSPRGNAMVSYATPSLYDDAEGRTLLICNSTANGITGLDVKTGQVMWSRDCFELRTVSSPVMTDELILGTCGSGGGGNYLVAINKGGNGVLDSDAERYRIEQAVTYVPTPLVIDKLLFMVSDKGGIASCFEVATGKKIWRQRIDSDLVFSGSPIGDGKRIFVVAHSGAVLVLAAEEAYRLLARNELGESSRCTPAISDGVMYLRTFNEAEQHTHLISIGAK